MQKFDSSSVEEQLIPQPGEPINFYQPNPHPLEYQYGCQNDYYFEPPNISGAPCCSRTSSFPETRFLEAGNVDESEAVDELLQILVECLKMADARTRKLLLGKFFSVIEKETALEGFLIERIQQSKISTLLLEKAPWCPQQDSDSIFDRDDGTGTGISGLATREVDGSSMEGTSNRLERFKVKTIQVGKIVKEEPAR